MLINGVFQGGGVKGISLAGAVKAAEQSGVHFHRLAGTSSGSIVASLLAAGYTADELKDIIMGTSFTSFLRRAPLFNITLIGPALRVILKKGLYSGEALEQWVRSALLLKGIRTFNDLERGKLSIVASDITRGKILVLPDDLIQLGFDPGRFEVAKAVRMSCSIPYFFDPVMLRMGPAIKRGRTFAEQFVYVVDGGVLSNLPLWLFDQRSLPKEGTRIPTVGFQMVGETTGKPHQIKGPFTMLEAIVETMLSAHDERYIEQSKRYRTIKIPTLGVSTTQFSLTEEESLRLYESGVSAGQEFFRNWDSKHYETQYQKYLPALNL
ncbi:patatin-like phospholipase family protein [Paenibacillus physcomitrellae]|uniref:Phospholipase n=1 Tax=Paenibacillus physcomitrellae TaxID=1619311 RepID=A0ABQ1FPI9_9BACL|nr:patatin-like phospholipase family protein [Paenibacillus physcomitrellae]GGA22273.1 phospholipase [Paenibacillus physcomitrellae]